MISILQRLSKVELPITLFFNRVNHRVLYSRFFATISRMGNGIFWYIIIASLPVIYGWSAVKHSLNMLAVGFVALIIYKSLKISTTRQRPYQMDKNIIQNIPVLDLYSFPSGHTMHAVSFSVVLTHFHPEWSWIVWPFTILVAFSRLILGLHYLSDVIVGAAIGFIVALVSFQF